MSAIAPPQPPHQPVNTFDQAVAVLAQALARLNPPPLRDWLPLGFIEAPRTRCGLHPEMLQGFPPPALETTLLLPEQGEMVFDDFRSRLHLAPWQDASTCELLAVQGQLIGDLRLEIWEDTPERSSLAAVYRVSGHKEPFRTPPLPLTDRPSGAALKLRLQALSRTVVWNLAWAGFDPRPAETPDGLRLILIRTFGNRQVVYENLAALEQYLAETHRKLERYLFVMYDATGAAARLPFGALSRLHILELRGANFGGGGNASLLVELARAAAAYPGTPPIAELALWDDDALLEPESFLRHDAWVRFRQPDVFHTAIVMHKREPARVQEAGGFWGAYFHRLTPKIAAERSAQRRMFPYLARANRQLNVNADRVRLSRLHDVEFGTFIFLSIPFALASTIPGPLPFFLRNDDVDYCLRLQQAGGRLCVNPNVLAWHEASHTASGEFLATLHGWIVNSVHFELPATDLLFEILNRLNAMFSVGNSVLLEAYRQALTLFAEGPPWFLSAQCPERYLAAIAAIKAQLARFDGIPEEVVDVLKQQHRVEIALLVDGLVRRGQEHSQMVFHDASCGRYWQPPAHQRDVVDDMYRDALRVVAKLTLHVEDIQEHWRIALRGFDGYRFWSRMAETRRNMIATVDADHASAQLATALQPLGMVDAKTPVPADPEPEPEQEPEPELREQLPADFDPESYLLLNPDVANSGIDPARHFVLFGIKEHRKYR